MNATRLRKTLQQAIKAVLPKNLGHFARRRAKHLRIGARGESMACRALREIGLDIIRRNYRVNGGEIDIIARDDCTLCFIEVKTRHKRPFSRPADAVGIGKRQRVIHAAQHYLRAIGRPPLRYNFGIVEVILSGWRLSEIRYLPAVFDENSVAVASGRGARGAADAKPLYIPRHVL